MQGVGRDHLAWGLKQSQLKTVADSRSAGYARVSFLSTYKWMRFASVLLFIATASLYHSTSHADLVAGDLAPYGSPDGALNTADVLILQRMVMGEITPTPTELLVGDVAPLNNSDGQLNAGDLVILQRAVLGQITLPPISTGSNPPTLDAGVSPTHNNPYNVTGTASPNTEVRLYVNSTYQTATTAAPDGSFSFNALLADGLNQIHTTEWDGTTESGASNTLSIDYDNIIPRNQSGTISVDTVWTPAGPGGSNDPYLISGNLTVSAGASLILPTGTVLKFASGVQLQVDGTLLVQGTAANPVVFTSDKATPAAGNWSGIKVNSGAVGVVIDHAQIAYANQGVTFTGAGGTLSNSVIENNITGIYISDASPAVQGNIVRNNSSFGIFITRLSNPVIDGGNEVTANGYGVFVQGGGAATDLNPHPVVTGNSLYANPQSNYYAQSFYDNANVQLDATGNWWGSVDAGVIGQTIYDYTDQPNNAPVVDYSGYLDGPGGVPVAGVYLNGVFNTNTTLPGGTVYTVLGDLNVAAGVTLTISAGAELRFPGNWDVTVDGTLLVQGTAANPVVFTSDKATPAAGNWSGIKVNSGAVGVVIDYAQIAYANQGVTFTGAGGTLSNSVIENNITGIYISDASPAVQGNIVRNNSSFGIFITRLSNPVIDGGNEVTANGYGVFVQGGGAATDLNPHPVVTGNSLYANPQSNYYAQSFYDNANVQLDATGNWWGSVDAGVIGQTIYDYTDQPNNAPVVDYSGYLDGPGGVPVAGVYLNGVFNTNTTLPGGTVYTVLGDLNVAAGVTLTISAGAELRFPGNWDVTVDGTLLVQGTAANPVVFTSDKATPAAGNWSGIKVNSGAVGVVIDYAQIAYANQGVTFTGAGGTLSNSVIENNITGIYISDASPAVQGNIVRNNSSFGIFITRLSNPVIDGGNEVTANGYGVFVQGGGAATDLNPHPVVTGNSLYANPQSNYYAQSFYDNANVQLDATGNWWGSVDAGVIGQTIYDYTDQPNNAPVVDYSGYLDGPGGVPVAGVYLNGVFNTNTTLPGGTVYTVLGDLNVAAGVTLTISAGAELRFPGNWDVTVDGTLLVQGTAANPVVFTSDKATPAAGNWSGIKVNSGAVGVVIDHAQIAYANQGVTFTGAGGTLSNSVIENNITGIYISDASPAVQGNIVRNNSSFGIFITRLSNPVIDGGNEVTANGYGVFVQGGGAATDLNPHPVVTGNSLYANPQSNYYAQSFYDNANVQLDATGNWWGSVDAGVIGQTIYDYTDQPNNAPVVDYSGYLDGPGGVPVAGVYLNGVFNTNTTLPGGTVYTVLGDLNVAAGVTLTISAGAELRFPGNWDVTVDGTLLVQGTAANPVVFTSDKATPAAGNWSGIKVNSGAVGVVIDYAQIAYANQGVTFTGAGGTLSNSVIENNITGIYISDASPAVQGNIVRNNSSFGIFITRLSNPVIDGGNEVTANGYGVFVQGGGAATDLNPHPVVTGNSLYANPQSNYYAQSFYDNANVQLDATGNWWGSVDAGVIGQTIYDYTDQPNNAPVVDYSGYLDGPGGVPVAGVYLNGVFNTNTTLPGGTVYTVLGDLNVAAGVTLTISAGAELRFPGNWDVTVDGTLLVQGTAANPVVFTSDKATPAAGNWSGIKVNSSGSATLDYAVVEYATNGIESRSASVNIANSLLHFNSYGLYLYQNSATVTVVDSQVVYNTQYGLYAFGTSNDSTNPQFSINSSDLFGNANSAIIVQNYGSSGLTLDATGNWWGASTPQLGVDVTGNSNAVLNIASPASAPLRAPALSSIAVDFLYISPANADAIQDVVQLSGPLSETSDWIVEVLDPLGVVVQTASGTGNAVSATWDGRDTLGQLQAEGQYSLVVTTTAGTRSGQAGRRYVIVDDTAPVSDLDDLLNGVTLQNVLIKDLNGSALDAHFAEYQVEYGAGASPTVWSPMSGVFTFPIDNDVLDSWIAGTVDGSFPVANGLHTLRLTVKDKAGNMSTDTVQLTVDNLAAHSVTEDIPGFSPTLSETIQIDFTLNLPADVTFNVYSSIDNTLVYTSSQTLLAGSNTFSWDGTDTLGATVAAGSYYYTLMATDGTRMGNYIPPFVSTTSDLFVSTGGFQPFNTFKNDYFNRAATAPTNGRARLRLRLATSPYNGQVVYPDGDGIDMQMGETREFIWDGRVPGTADIYIGSVTAYLDFTPYGPNYVVVKTAAPIIKGPDTVGPAAPYLEVKADPYIVYLSYGQLVKVHYNIDRDAQVTIKLLPPGVVDFDDPSAVLVKDELQTAQDHSVEWQGLVTAGDGRDRSLPADGVYTLAIKAVSTASGGSTIYKAVLSAFQ